MSNLFCTFVVEKGNNITNNKKSKVMNTIDALKEIAWQVGIEEFTDEENEQELVNRMRGYINAGHEELGLDAVVLDWAEDATDEQIITAINEYLKELDEER